MRATVSRSLPLAARLQVSPPLRPLHLSSTTAAPSLGAIEILSMLHHFYLFLLAAIQGVTELFPISSLGHSILVPALFRWPIDRDASWFLPFIVVLHLGTCGGTAEFLLARLGRVDWRFSAGSGSRAARACRLLWLLILASIPAGLLGLALAHRIKDLFGGFSFAAVALMVNGALLIWGDRLRAREPSHTLERLSWRRALIIGFAQSLALIPGFSRSGATLVAGIGVGLDYANSARFRFSWLRPINIWCCGLIGSAKASPSTSASRTSRRDHSLQGNLCHLCLVFRMVFDAVFSPARNQGITPVWNILHSLWRFCVDCR